MTYADLVSVRAYLAEHGLASEGDDAALTLLIERAERDLDRVIGGPKPTDQALRIDPVELTDAQRDALARGTAAQVEYRIVSGGERSWAESEDLSSGDVRVLSPWTRVGPKVAEELAGHSLIKRTLCAAPTPEPEPEPEP